ncbi:LytR/AlgR family response regulator transcription factor [Aquimarina litoralis]|uniref:LytR/AlgR family response regulator transcription factor n=1 Tax=Aquimarina litoralis TaxID=584605 RepID=UPI001C562BFD|nr:LytTR family DNA-binding domain-containing protein [Aquimarina litoralis]MBW1298293.1 hypothetical protein [Aquimarina litoralis]
MFLNKVFPYISSFKKHLQIASLLSFAVVFILEFLQPFGANNFNHPYKHLYFIGYGVISLAIYLFIHLLSIWYHTNFKRWKWIEELLFSSLYVTVAIVIAFFYTELMINKRSNFMIFSFFIKWFRFVFLGFGIILSVLSVFLRLHYGKKQLHGNQKKPNDNKKIVVKSTLKKESFLIVPENIVYVKSEDNYINIHYLEDNVLQKKVMRNTLSSIHKQLNYLLKVHRSYIINPDFITSVEGNAQKGSVHLKYIEEKLPVSKTYFESVKSSFMS